MIRAAAFMKPEHNRMGDEIDGAAQLDQTENKLNAAHHEGEQQGQANIFFGTGDGQGLTAAAVISERMATGPVANCRDDPHRAPRTAGIKAV